MQSEPVMQAQSHVLGKILGAYGVKGWVKVETFAPAADSLLKTRTVWRTANGTNFSVLSCRVHGAGPSACLVAQLDGVPSREAAQALRGNALVMDRSEFPTAAAASPGADEPDSYYAADLLGLSVINRQNELLGSVRAVDSHGAGEFLVVQSDEATGPECLIPFRSIYVDAVDVTSKVIRVDWGRDW